MPSIKKLLQAAAGNAGGGALYVEDVFSTYLYTGNATSTQTITNGIDLDGEGGLVWIKNRDASTVHILTDSEAQVLLNSNNTNSGGTGYWPTYFNFNSDGFTTTNTVGDSKTSGDDFASWSFRKAEKFFDVVTYSTDPAPHHSKTIPHNLGVIPAVIIIKVTSTISSWFVFHKDLTNNSLGSYRNYCLLNLTNAEADSGGAYLTATDTEFTIESFITDTDKDHVVYLFAHDAGGFGDDGSENIISCGSYTGAGADLNINVGFEPQFVLIKSSSNATNWVMFDTMRGLPVDGNAKDLRPNLSDAEGDNSAIGITSTGFLARNGIDGQINANGYSYIYIAIRRPMKTPESGTEVFAADNEANSTAPWFTSGFPVDWAWQKQQNAATNWNLGTRLLSGTSLRSDSDVEELTFSSFVFDYMDGWNSTTGTASNMYSAMFKRATGFFDVVAYTGDGTSNRSINHNLGVTPELIIGKIRSGQTDYWGVWQASLGDQGMYLAATNSAGVTLVVEGHTSSIFKVSNGYGINNVSTLPHIAYLFGSVAGVSKVGSYTGTGADLNVDCGFSAGARFILIKRTDSTGDWYVYDSVRGIVVGNDPYLLLNSTDAEVTGTDYIDPLSSGFTVTSSAPAALNASGGTYIFLAIA
jgi:hypothetical protein